MKIFASAFLAASALATSLESSAEYGLSEYDYLELPGDLCCRFFRGWHYTDAYEGDYCINDRTGVTNYTVENQYWSTFGSYICGKNVAVDVCDGPPEVAEVTGDKTCRIKTAGAVMNPGIAMGEVLNFWVTMEYYNPAIRGAVTTFDRSDCYYTSNRYFEARNNPLGALYRFKEVYPGQQNANSVQVPYGYTLITYAPASDGSYEGEELERIVGDYADSKLQTPKCQNLNQKIDHYYYEGEMSWKVVRNHNAQNPDPAVGFWKSLLVSTESQEFEYHVGVTSSESIGSSSENSSSFGSNVEGYEEYTKEQYMERAISNGITASVTVGGSFKFFSAESTIEGSHEQTDTNGSSYGETRGAAWGSASEVSNLVAQDAQASLQEEYSSVHKTTCKTDGANGAGLYQFVYSTTDGKASLHTPHIVCRTGEHWNTPPACTWEACKNADCTCCMGDPDC